MVDTSKYMRHSSSTTNTFVYCRIASRKALKIAETEKIGRFYFLMMAGVFATFTVEAFLNHIGQSKIEDWAIHERKLGPHGKLLLLQQHLKINIDESCRPYITLRSMIKMRNALAHGKTEMVKTERIIIPLEIDDDEYPEPEWRQLCSLPLIREMVEDSENIARDINKQIGNSIDPFISPGHGDSVVTKV
jgi:hypothetical protein